MKTAINETNNSDPVQFQSKNTTSTIYGTMRGFHEHTSHFLFESGFFQCPIGSKQEKKLLFDALPCCRSP